MEVKQTNEYNYEVLLATNQRDLAEIIAESEIQNENDFRQESTKTTDVHKESEIANESEYREEFANNSIESQEYFDIMNETILKEQLDSTTEKQRKSVANDEAKNLDESTEKIETTETRYESESEISSDAESEKICESEFETSHEAESSQESSDSEIFNIEIKIDNFKGVNSVHLDYVDDFPLKNSKDKFLSYYKQMYGKTWIQQGPKQFLCLICKKYLKSSIVLFNHINIHNDMRLYKCDYCAETFHSSRKLQEHGRKTHQFEFGYILSCPYCKKNYKSDRLYLKHVTYEEIVNGKTQVLQNDSVQ